MVLQRLWCWAAAIAGGLETVLEDLRWPFSQTETEGSNMGNGAVKTAAVREKEALPVCSGFVKGDVWGTELSQVVCKIQTLEKITFCPEWLRNCIWLEHQALKAKKENNPSEFRTLLLTKWTEGAVKLPLNFLKFSFTTKRHTDTALPWGKKKKKSRDSSLFLKLIVLNLIQKLQAWGIFPGLWSTWFH